MSAAALVFARPGAAVDRPMRRRGSEVLVSSGHDRQRFEAVFHACHRAVVGYALRRTDSDTADEVVSETFLVVWRRLADVPADDPVPWVLGIAHKVLANQYRSQRRQHVLAQRVASVDPPSSPAGADEGVDGVHEPVRLAMARLNERDREILRLHAWEDLDTPGLAEVLGCSTANAAVRLHRARKRLERALAEVHR